MKLEIKHLAPYLPYELKMQVKDYHGIEYVSQILTTENIGNFINGEECKPILRPLSDLNKEGLYIEHLNIETITDESNIQDLDIYLENWIDSKDTNHHVKFLPYGLVNELISEHFDVFGLIPKGLAIDINTL
jgi:hypothetical protein